MRVIHCAVFVAFASIFLFPVTDRALAETMAERGAYLVNGIGTCGNCHTPRGGPMKGKPFAGGSPFGGPKAPFTAYASNITPDEETGIGSWTDAQIMRAFREGKRPDGSTIGPPMAIELYRGISDSDAKAIVAYLRTLKPVRNKVKKSVYRMKLPKAYGPPIGMVADVPKSDKVAYGAYLAGPMGHCIECHTPMVRGHSDYKNDVGRGGRVFHGPWGATVSRNITPHPDDGLGKWSDAEIKRAITKGIRRDGSRLKPPMGYPLYNTMTDSDLNAIVAYLRSIKPLASK